MVAVNRDVFINCPFDGTYQPLFRAMVFVVLRSGFRARCALETDDASENRFEKICKIIEHCRYGIHDISRTEVDRGSRLPRFNMPLELGIFLAAKRFGSGHQKVKRCIIFDRERYRYQKYISDISGQDIHSHAGRAARLIEELASWLRDLERNSRIPGGRRMAEEYNVFRREMRNICRQRDLAEDEFTFGDFANMTAEYLAAIA